MPHRDEKKKRTYGSKNATAEDKAQLWYESITPEEKRAVRKAAIEKLKGEFAGQNEQLVQKTIEEYQKRQTGILDDIFTELKKSKKPKDQRLSFAHQVQKVNEIHPEWSAARIARHLAPDLKVNWNSLETNDNYTTAKERLTEAVKKALYRLNKRLK